MRPESSLHGRLSKLRAIGNSAGVTIPKPMLDRYRMAEGDEVHLVETDEGILITPFDPTFAKAMEIYEEGAEAYRAAIRRRIHPPWTAPLPGRSSLELLAVATAIASCLLRHPDAILRTARQNLGLTRARHPAAHSLLREWECFSISLSSILAAALVDPSPRGRELRQVTPFAGVLSASERVEVYRTFAEEEVEP